MIGLNFEIKQDKERAEIFQHELEQQIHSSARRGSLFLFGLGVVGMAFTLGAHFSNLPGEFLGPTVIAATGALFSILVYGLARTNRLRGAINYFLMAAFINIPTLFFFSGHFLYPLGTISFMHGPLVYMYFFIIMLSGFFFDFRLSLMTSLIGAVGFLACYLLGQKQAMQIQIQDAILQTDIIRLEIFVIRSVFIALFGPVVGGLSILARRLIIKVRGAEEERNRIDRLFGQYVSDAVREKIKSATAGVDGHTEIGETKSVVILFCDLRDFSSYSEGQQPREIVKHLNEYFDAMVEAIAQHGGVVDKFIGDAIMAVFGGVLELDNPCQSAVQAALQMQHKLTHLNQQWQAAGQQTLAAGIGLHYGEVLQGNLGSARRKEFTVIGDAVNAASRLEGITRELKQSIVLSRQVYELLPAAMQSDLSALGKIKVKGKSQELEVFGV